MIRGRLQRVLNKHDMPWSQALLADLEGVVEELVEKAWLDNDQALELLPQINGVNSLGTYLKKHQVRRLTAVQRTSDVLRAIARGDRRKRRGWQER